MTMLNATATVEETPQLTQAFVLELVRRAMPAAEPQKSMGADDSLHELGLGSLKLLSLILDLEERFQLPAAALERLCSRPTLATVLGLCADAEASFDDGRR
jgi:acyl carrier protein